MAHVAVAGNPLKRFTGEAGRYVSSLQGGYLLRGGVCHQIATRAASASIGTYLPSMTIPAVSMSSLSTAFFGLYGYGLTQALNEQIFYSYTY